MPLIEGVFSEQTVRGGLPLFPHVPYILEYENLAIPAGDSVVTMDTVPAGTVRILTHVVFYYNGTAPAQAGVFLDRAGLTLMLGAKKGPVDDEHYIFHVWAMAIEGDTIGYYITTGTLNNDFKVYVGGYDIVLAS